MNYPTNKLAASSSNNLNLAQAYFESSIQESVAQVRNELEQSLQANLRKYVVAGIQQALDQFQNSAISNLHSPETSRYYSQSPFHTYSPISLPFPESPPIQATPTTMVMSAPYMTAQMPQPTIVPPFTTHTIPQPTIYHQHQFAENPHYPEPPIGPNTIYHQHQFAEDPYYPEPPIEPNTIYHQHQFAENPYYPEPPIEPNTYYSSNVYYQHTYPNLSHNLESTITTEPYYPPPESMDTPIPPYPHTYGENPYHTEPQMFNPHHTPHYTINQTTQTIPNYQYPFTPYQANGPTACTNDILLVHESSETGSPMDKFNNDTQQGDIDELQQQNTTEILVPSSKVCAVIESVRDGDVMHGRAVKYGFELDLFVRNSWIHMYSVCGRIFDARKVFDASPESDLVTWNSMIAGYVGAEDMEAAIELFEKMPLRDIVSWNCVIDGYARIGNVSAAREVFDRMPLRNVVSWNYMLALYIQGKKYSECLELFDRMLEGGEAKPNVASLVSVLTACASLGKLERGQWVNLYIKTAGMEPEVLLSTALLTMYAKCGAMNLARYVFDAMPEKNVVSWNSMIMGYGMHGHGEKALEMFLHSDATSHKWALGAFAELLDNSLDEGEDGMSPTQSMGMLSYTFLGSTGKEDIDVAIRYYLVAIELRPNFADAWSNLVSAYMRKGRLSEAAQCCRQALALNPRLVDAHSNLGNLMKVQGLVQEAYNCYLEALGIQSDFAIAWSNLGLLMEAGDLNRALHYYKEAVKLRPTFLDAYLNLGNVYKALGMRQETVVCYQRAVQTQPDYAMDMAIVYYKQAIACDAGFWEAYNNLGNDQMKKLGLEPNRGIFFSIICAYSLARMVDEGKRLFSSMIDDYQILPGFEHNSAIIDLFGRSGRLEEAIDFIEEYKLEISLIHHAYIYSGCSQWSYMCICVSVIVNSQSSSWSWWIILKASFFEKQQKNYLSTTQLKGKVSQEDMQLW